MDDTDPWEQLDVDDSDLRSFTLRPCKRSGAASNSRKSSNPPPNLSSSSRIPGPAGAVQAAMQRRTEDRRHQTYAEEEPIPTQEFVRRIVEKGDDQDSDFAADPWLCALDFVTRQGGDFPTPLGSIRKGVNTHKIALVVAIIKTCNPDGLGLGDLLLTLKDPTGTVGASIHHTALSERDFGKRICVGAVLVLQKISVFSPLRCSSYLNITKNNLVQVISQDSGPVVTEDLLTSSVNNHALVNESSERLWMPQEKFPPSQESTERIMNDVRSSRVNIEEHMETDHQAFGSQQRGSRVAGVEKEPSVVKQAKSDVIRKLAVRGSTIDNEQVTVVAKKPNPHRVAGGDNPSYITQVINDVPLVAEKPNIGRVSEGDNPSSTTQPVSASANSVDDQEVRGITGTKRQRQPLISSTSVPEYTEEELDLFEFD